MFDVKEYVFGDELKKIKIFTPVSRNSFFYEKYDIKVLLGIMFSKITKYYFGLNILKAF